MNSNNNQNDIEKSDRYIKTVKYLEARSKEMDYFQHTLQNKKMTDTKSVQQGLPKHMRRRSMSHNRNRIPSKIRKIAKYGFADNHKKNKNYSSRKTARKRLFKSKTNLNYLWKYNHLSHIKILETHQFMSKRNHMQNYYGYKIALQSQQKRFKTTYKFNKNFQLVCDKSYYKTILVKGGFDQIIEEAQKWQSKFINYFFYIQGSEYLIFLIDPSLFEEIQKYIQKYQNDSNIQIEYKILDQFFNIFELQGNQCLKGLNDFITNHQLENNDFDFFKGYFSGLQVPNNLQLICSIKYQQRSQYNNQQFNNQEDYNEQIQKLYNLCQDYSVDYLQTDDFIKNLLQIQDQKIDYLKDIKIKDGIDNCQQSVLLESIFNNDKQHITIENIFSCHKINFLIKNFSVKSDQLRQSFSRFIILSPPSTGNFFIKNLVNSNMLLIAQKEYEFLMHNLNIPVFPRDYLDIQQCRVNYNEYISKNIQKFQKKQPQYRYNYILNNFQYPFGLNFQNIQIQNQNIVKVFIQMIGKGTIKQNAQIHAMQEQDLDIIKSKKQIYQQNKVLDQILNFQLNNFQLIEPQNTSQQIQDFENIEKYLEHLQQLKPLRQVIGSVTYGNFNYTIQKPTGFGYILPSMLQNTQNECNFPDIVWIRNPNSSNYHAANLTKIINQFFYQINLKLKNVYVAQFLIMSSKIRKLLQLLKCHKKESIKVGLLITAHSLSYIGIPYIFKGTQLLKENENQEKDSDNQDQKQQTSENKNETKNKHIEKIKQKFNNLPLQQKYATYFGVCLTYLVFIGILTKHQIYHSRKLEDLFTITLRRRVFRRLFVDRKQQFDQSVAVQKSISDIYRMTSSLAQSYFMILRGLVFSATGLTATVYYFPELGILTGIYLFMFGLRNRWYSQKIQDASKMQVQYLQKISAEMGEFTQNRKYVILNQMEKLSEQIFEQRMQDHHQRILDLANIRGKQVFFLETFGIGYILSLITYGTYLIATGNLLTQDLSLSIFALYGALGLRRLNSGFIELREKLGILDTIENFFQIDLLENIEKERFQQDGNLNEQFMHDLENSFNNIENVYQIENQIDNKHISILENYLKKQINQTIVEIEHLQIPVMIKNEKSSRIIENLKVVPGECLGIFGPSGIGKTSLFDFISGFRHIEETDKINFTTTQQKEQRIFYFTQIPQIFNKSFIFNVVIGNVPLLKYILSLEELTYQEKQDLIIFHARNAMIKANILDKCQQSQSVNNLSAGEKQRLIFARLFFSNSDLILLDESMANLDYFNSKKISKELKEFMKNRTGFFIAHSKRIVDEVCNGKVYNIK